MRNKTWFYCVFAIVSVLCLSIGYSAFNNEMLVQDISAQFRIEKDVRITNLTLDASRTTPGVSSNHEFNYALIASDIELPSADSKVTYEVEILNLGATEVGIFDITNIPSNLKMSLENYNMKDMICNEKNECNLGVYKKFYLTVGYKDGYYNSSDISHTINLMFDFRIFYNVDYIGIAESNYPTKAIQGDIFSIVLPDVSSQYIEVTAGGGVLVSGVDYIFQDSNKKLTIYDINDNIIIINSDSLPDNYLRLDYIVSNGNQYIDTGVIAKTGLRSDITLSFKNLVGGDSDDYGILGARKSNSGNYNRIYLLHYYNGFALGYGYYHPTSVRLANNKIYEVHSEINQGNQFINVDRTRAVTTSLNESYNLGLNLYLFAINQDGQAYYPSSIILYHCKIYDGETLIRDFIPVMNLEEKSAGLYDLVNNVYYSNQGTSPFITSEIVSTYTEIAYIESNGNSYFDTGVNAKSGLSTEMDIEFKKTGSSYDYTILGARKRLAGSSTYDRLYLVHYVGGMTIGYGGYYTSSASIVNDVRYNITAGLDAGTQYLEVDGNRLLNRTSSTVYDLGLPLYLLSCNEENVPKYYAPIRLYYCKIFDNGTLVRDFVPVMRDVDGAYGLLDKVENKFYLSLGNGLLVGG